jgi:hypothetical protein
MSKHFRHVKDAIATQLRVTQKAMGEDNKISTVSGATKGETPRLKLLDQKLREQNLFQQGGMLYSNPWRPQRGLPFNAVSILRAWLFEHFLNPLELIFLLIFNDSPYNLTSVGINFITNHFNHAIAFCLYAQISTSKSLMSVI